MRSTALFKGLARVSAPDFALRNPARGLTGLGAAPVAIAFADPEDDAIVAGTTSYGLEFCSAVAWDNVAAVQFHPEKSGPTGLRLYGNFVDLVRANRDSR